MPKIVTAQKTGNSITAVLPSNFCDQLGIEPGDKLVSRMDGPIISFRKVDK